MLTAESKGLRFPCPICARALDVRESKKAKPYVICDVCGVQMFVRDRAGIDAFKDLAARGERDNIWQQLADLRKRYLVTCQKCRAEFWADARLIRTSIFDGSFQGFRCERKNCDGTAKWEANAK